MFSLHMLTAYLLTALFCGIAHSLPISYFEASIPIAKIIKAGPCLSDLPGSHHRRLAARLSSIRYPTRYPDVVQRTETPGGLFGDNGVPDLADVEQTSIPDCGLIAVLGALVGQNPKWITNLVSFVGDASSTRYATFKLVQPDNLKPATQKVAKAALTNVRSDSHEGWWVGGIEQAVRQMGRDVAMLPSEALEMTTRRKARFYFTATRKEAPADSLSREDTWKLIAANAHKTPMILQSIQENPAILDKGHAFWIMSGNQNDGKRWITLWNPHGENEVHDFDMIWLDSYALYSFVDISARP